MWKLIKSKMNAFGPLFQSCSPKEDSAKHRRPSNFSIASTQSKTQAVIRAIERELGILVHAVHEFPNVIEDKFDEFIQAVVEIPVATFDDVIHTMNE
jgi:hypothetical protein